MKNLKDSKYKATLNKFYWDYWNYLCK